MILLGAPGVGKVTQAELLNQRLLACHLSTGEVFRSSATRSDAKQSPAMKEALVHMRQGEVVPDGTVWEMVREHGECLHCAGGFVLAGFPRTVAQPVLLEQFLDQGLLTALIATAHERHRSPVGRPPNLGDVQVAVSHDGTTAESGGTLAIAAPASGFSAKMTARESIQVRPKAYDRSTAPLIDFYGKAGLLLPVSAAGTPEEIYDRTLPQWEARRLLPWAEQRWAAEANRRDT